MSKIIVVLVSRILLIICFNCQVFAAEKLKGYNVQPGDVTVSGISSGAYMAVQLAVAHSASIHGVGAIAGGPYFCAQNSVTTATNNCMIGLPDLNASKKIAEQWERTEQIDSLANLSKQKIWLFNGYNDGVVKKSVTDALYRFYASYTDEHNIFYKTNINAGHAQITASYGQPCSYTGGNFINDCHYDSAGFILQHLYGALKPKQKGKLSGTLLKVAQTDFYDGEIWDLSMSHDGYVYVPAQCAQQQQCRLHVALHGCKQYAELIGSDYYAHAGYNEWADSNGIIVLYPQTVATTLMTFNPKGCWDWWGYVDPNYANKNGKQIVVLKAMIDRIVSRYSSENRQMDAFSEPKNLLAADRTDTQIELIWKGNSAVTGYNVYRASCPSCSFNKLNAKPIQGNSMSDIGLRSQTQYFYKVRAVDKNGNESQDSIVVSQVTAQPKPVCDPYHRDNYSHWQEGRANMIFGFEYAKGSNELMGAGTIYSETALKKIKSDFFQIGVCK